MDGCGHSDALDVKCSVTTLPKGVARELGPCSNNVDNGMPSCGTLANGTTPLNPSDAAQLLAMMNA